MIAFALFLALTAADPVALEAGSAAPFAGVLLDGDRLEQLLRAEAERNALQERLVEEVAIREAWRALVLSPGLPTSSSSVLEDPEANRWLGFLGGVIFATGAIVGGAWVSGVAVDAGGG